MTGILPVTVALVLVGPAALGQTTLPNDEIQAAIDWGTSHDDITPYLLRHAQGDGTNSVVVGAVYTPFLRVALLARQALEQGHRLEPADLPAGVTELRIDIAARWYMQIQGCALADHANVVAVRRGTGAGPTRRRDGFPPTTSRPISWLQTFAAPTPFPDVSVVVSYPVEFIRDDIDFLVWKKGASQTDGLSCESVEIGRIPSVELRTWR